MKARALVEAELDDLKSEILPDAWMEAYARKHGYTGNRKTGMWTRRVRINPEGTATIILYPHLHLIKVLVMIKGQDTLMATTETLEQDAAVKTEAGMAKFQRYLGVHEFWDRSDVRTWLRDIGFKVGY